MSHKITSSIKPQSQQHPVLVLQVLTLAWQKMTSNKVWQPETDSFRKWNHSHDNIIKTQSVHLGTKGQWHGIWHQVANHQEGKRLQGKPLQLQFMPFQETLYFDCLQCFSLKQTTWAGKQVSSWKQVLCNQTNVLLQPSTDLKFPT